MAISETASGIFLSLETPLINSSMVIPRILPSSDRFLRIMLLFHLKLYTLDFYILKSMYWDMFGKVADKVMGRDTEILSIEALRDEKPDELPIDREQPEEEDLETATFSMGCFWGPDARFGAIPGVVRTRVGYAGGEKPDPTYHDLGNHAETIQIDFKPEEISYRELLKIFWNSHSCTSSRTGQYRSMIFFQNGEQRKKAQNSLEDLAESEAVKTQIEKLENFNLAENYHQKYHLRQRNDFLKFFQNIYSAGQLINSTAAAKINGIIAGFGKESFEREIDSYGLEEDLKKVIIKGL